MKTMTRDFLKCSSKQINYPIFLVEPGYLNLKYNLQCALVLLLPLLSCENAWQSPRVSQFVMYLRLIPEKGLGL